MPATVIAKEGAGRRIVGAITPGAESGIAVFDRCISLGGYSRGRGQHSFRRGRTSVQNVRIVMVERERAGSWMAAWANTGVSVIADRSAAAVRFLNEVMAVFL